MQFQSDILDVKVEKPECIETTALGAAYLAGLATGYWTSEEDIRQNWKLRRAYLPQMEEEKRKELIHGWDKAVGRSLKWEEA